MRGAVRIAVGAYLAADLLALLARGVHAGKGTVGVIASGLGVFDEGTH